MTLEIDYTGEHELHVTVCRTPTGKLYLHMQDEPGEVHGESTRSVDAEETVFIPEDKITEVTA